LGKIDQSFNDIYSDVVLFVLDKVFDAVEEFVLVSRVKILGKILKFDSTLDFFTLRLREAYFLERGTSSWQRLEYTLRIMASLAILPHKL
jgi:hypothetical protein